MPPVVRSGNQLLLYALESERRSHNSQKFIVVGFIMFGGSSPDKARA